MINYKKRSCSYKLIIQIQNIENELDYGHDNFKVPYIVLYSFKALKNSFN